MSKTGVENIVIFCVSQFCLVIAAMEGAATDTSRLTRGELKQLFEEIDVDHNGYVDVQELSVLIETLVCQPVFVYPLGFPSASFPSFNVFVVCGAESFWLFSKFFFLVNDRPVCLIN